MFKRYPHSCVISFMTGASTLNSVGVYSPGTLTTISTPCRVEHVSGEYVVNNMGAREDINYDVFCPKLSVSIPAGSTLIFANKRLTIVDFLPTQYITHIRCK